MSQFIDKFVLAISALSVTALILFFAYVYLSHLPKAYYTMRNWPAAIHERVVNAWLEKPKLINWYTNGNKPPEIEAACKVSKDTKRFQEEIIKAYNGVAGYVSPLRRSGQARIKDLRAFFLRRRYRGSFS